jgi:hypothetical protein
MMGTAGVVWCPDCLGTVKVTRKAGRLLATVWHDVSCPALRTARARRAVDRYLTDVLATIWTMAHYGDDIEGQHRKREAFR